MKKLLAILLTALLLLGLAACGANAPAEDKAAAYNEAAAPDYYRYEGTGAYVSPEAEAPAYAPDSALYDPSGSGTGKESAPAEAAGGQKLIRKVRLSVETDDYQLFIDGLNQKIFELGGYIEDIEARTSGSTPSATITVRVPADQLTALTDSIAGIGNITYKHESQQDVTLQYVDTESRIAALRTEQERLLSLLEQAENLTEILEIEDRMTHVRYELESFERSLRALSNQVEYATATIQVEQVRVFTPTEQVGYWENIRNGLSDSLRGLWEFLKDLFSFLVTSLPYLLVFVLIPVIILIVVIKASRRRRKARQAAAPKNPVPQAQSSVPPQSYAQPAENAPKSEE